MCTSRRCASCSGRARSSRSPGRGYQFNPPGPLVSSTDGGAPTAALATLAAPPPSSNAPTESATASTRLAAPALFGRDDELAAVKAPQAAEACALALQR